MTENKTEVPASILSKMLNLMHVVMKGKNPTEDALLIAKNKDIFEDLMQDLRELRVYNLPQMVEKRDQMRKEIYDIVTTPGNRLIAAWDNFVRNTAYDQPNREAMMKVFTSACIFFPLIEENLPCVATHPHIHTDKINQEIDVLFPKIVSFFKKLRDANETVTKVELIQNADEIRSIGRECEVSECTKSQKEAREDALESIAKIPEEDRLETFCKMMLNVSAIMDLRTSAVFMISAFPVLASLLPEPEDRPVMLQ